MSAHHVLALLEDCEPRMWSAFDQAVALAGEHDARLTLAKTTDPGLLMRWFAPAALQSMCVSAEDLDFRRLAGHRLALAAEFVPSRIPVTTLVLGFNTTRAVSELVRDGAYDAVVATGVLLNRHRRLRRELVARGLRTVVAPRRPDPALSLHEDSVDHAPFGAISKGGR
ncbi:MAG TPA: hypothetical protein VHX62_04010 [Solirubrobacteraceae bacterium]|nr:hypothetical protein [Solirubrobacteraceae bacterium]